MQRFRKILCVMEHDTDGKPALERAIALAEQNRAELTVAGLAPRLPGVAGLPDGSASAGELQAAIERDYAARIEALLAPYRQTPGLSHRVMAGTGFLEITREVLRNGHDLVIKCPESPTWLDRLFAGDDMHLLRKCPCPVWFIKPRAATPYRRILAAVDVGEQYPPEELETRYRLNVRVLEIAGSLALSESAELHVVHAWESVAELANGLVFSSGMSPEQLSSNVDQERLRQQRLLVALLRDVGSGRGDAQDARGYPEPTTHLVKGSARKEIPALAKTLAVDCIVMGTVARTGIQGLFMGNTAETILEQIESSVLAIKPEGFVTPVTLDD